MVVEVASPEEALEWAAKIAAACRCAQEIRAFGPDPELDEMLRRQLGDGDVNQPGLNGQAPQRQHVGRL